MRQLEWESFALKLKYPFRISRSVIEERETFFVRFGQGVGETSFSTYYGETREQAIETFERVDGKLSFNPSDFENNRQIVEEIAGGVKSAQAGVEMALLDHAARLLGRPIFAYLGLSKPATIKTTMTVALATPAEMALRAKEAFEFSALKLKVGVEGDIERVEAVRKVSSQPIRGKLRFLDDCRNNVVTRRKKGEWTGYHAEMIIVSRWIKMAQPGITAQELPAKAKTIVERLTQMPPKQRMIIAANAECCKHCHYMLAHLGIEHPIPTNPTATKTGWWNPLTDEVYANASPEFKKNIPGQ